MTIDLQILYQISFMQYSRPAYSDEQFYKKLLSESQQIESTLSEFANSLFFSLNKLQVYDLHLKPFTTPQMEQIRKQVSEMITNMKQKMGKDVEIISSVLRCIKQTTDYFYRLINMRNQEKNRNQQQMDKLDSKVETLEQQIGQWVKEVEKKKQQKEIEKWKQQHYVTRSPRQQFPIIKSNGEDYLKMMQDLKNQTLYKIEFYKKQNGFIINKIDSKLLDFKVRLINAWMLLTPIHNNNYRISTIKKEECENEESFQIGISNFERKYVQKEREIDEFEQSKFNYIKKQLRYLDEINLSESRQNLSYSNSNSQLLEDQSFVI